jgi:murein DD-endopeptidase MepM/ murein hydrolase activator NlpD
MTSTPSGGREPPSDRGGTVRAGQWVSHGQTLGTLAKYGYSACYQVNNNDGVHVHLEVYSNRHYACFVSGSPDVPVTYWGVIGRLGGHYADRAHAACP